MQQLQSLCFHGDGEQTNPRGIAAWTVKRRHGTGFHGVLPHDEHDRNRRSRGLGGCCRGTSPDQNDHSYTAIHQLDRLFRKAIVLSLRPAVFDCNVATLDVAGLSEALLDCRDIRRVRGRRYAGQDSDHRHRLLLRARASGHAAAPPSSVMNSRLFIRSPRRRGQEA